MSDSTIEGKVVVVTGASSGIGEATAQLLVERGARVVLGARGEERLAAVAARLGGDAVAFRATDVRRREDVAALVALARERFGRVDVMLNNAGIGPISPLDELLVDEWDAMVDINLKGVLHGVAAALPVFRAQGSGHIITTASTAGLKVVPTMAVYAATKTAVRVFMEGLRQEAGPDLRVTLITPGYVRTNFADEVSSPTIRAQIEQGMDDFGIAPIDVARAIVFAVEQPATVDIGEITIRPTAQA